jgi:lysophospholipase L1-like esterase
MFGIAVFGDSVTFGRGDDGSRGWAGRLQRYFEEKGRGNALYNLGIPGDTSSALLKRMDAECRARLTKLSKQDKFILIVAIGLNDSRFLGQFENPQTTAEQFKKNIKKISEIAKKYADKIVFVGLTPVDEALTSPYTDVYFLNRRVEEFNQILKENSDADSFLFIDVYGKLSKKNLKGVLDDGLHPSANGYELMYGIIKQKMIEQNLID